jgi:hypothetical protein
MIYEKCGLGFSQQSHIISNCRGFKEWYCQREITQAPEFESQKGWTLSAFRHRQVIALHNSSASYKDKAQSVALSAISETYVA